MYVENAEKIAMMSSNINAVPDEDIVQHKDNETAAPNENTDYHLSDLAASMSTSTNAVNPTEDKDSYLLPVVWFNLIQDRGFEKEGDSRQRFHYFSSNRFFKNNTYCRFCSVYFCFQNR